MEQRLIEQLATKGEVQIAQPLAKYTSWRVGGVAAVVFSPYTIESLRESIKLLNAEEIRYKVLGKGSNILASDHPFEGVIIMLTQLSPQLVQQSNNRFIISAGASLPHMSRKLAKLGYKGHEFLSGIPGTIGGAIVMNAGTPQGEVQDVLVQAQVIDDQGEIHWLSNEALQFSYRHSLLKDTTTYTVLAGDFFFEDDEQGESLEHITRNKELRTARQPLKFPNCGSVFKNPPNGYAGELIEKSGLKGYQIGGAMVSTLHANFIINTGDARAEEIFELIEHVKQTIAQDHGVTLETEVEYFNW